MTYPSRIIGWPRFIHPGWKAMLDAGRFPPEIEAMSTEPNPIQKQAIGQFSEVEFPPVEEEI